jgi:uncharacterized repeat protein (TIGR01451 family)
MSLVVRDSGREIPMQVEALGETEIVEGLRLARVAPENTLQAIQALNSRPDVLYAEPNYVRYKTGVPNDTQYAQQWSLRNTGQSGGTANADIRAEQAWNTTTGSRNVVVGVIDEGVDITHPDLKDNIWKNPSEIPGNNIDDDGNGFVDDVNGWDFFHNDKSVFDGASDATGETDAHGTHVSGTIGAVGNNGMGVAGVNWQVSIMSLKILGSHNETPAQSSVLLTVQAYSYARMMRELWAGSGGTRGANIRVLNNSYGGAGNSQAELDAIRALGQSDILFVVAAGNDSESNDLSPLYPASYDAPNLISVASTDRNDNLSSFSNFGARTVHLAAPGSSILSTTPHNTYSYYDGTSMATPHVAGAAALLCAAYPNLTVQQLRAALIFSSDELAALDGKVASGRRLNVASALQNAGISDATPPLINDLHILGQVDRHVALAWTAPGDDGTVGRASLYEIRFVDQSTGKEFLLATMRPATAGTPQFINVNIPYKHTSGTFILKAFDKAGNVGSASVNVAVGAEVSDPYVVTESAVSPLSTGGSPMRLNYDDAFQGYSLPFNFPFFEGYVSTIQLSTNGTIYLSNAAPHNDALSLTSNLAGRQMIAGLWDDLDLSEVWRPGADIYVVKPNADSVIFRWQGVPCNTNFATGRCAGGEPVNFEIELRRDGTIIKRYGDGNKQLAPVVGIGGGEPEAYVIASHTSEFTPMDVTNAPTVTYSLRSLPKSADVGVSVTSVYPNPVRVGQNLQYTLTISNSGPNTAASVVFTDSLSNYTTFINCTSSAGSCTGPAGGGTGGKVTANLGSLASGANATVSILVNATNNPSSTFDSRASVTSSTYDPNPSNNSSDFFSGVAFTNPKPLRSVSNIAAGRTHSLALLPGGDVLAWGDNTSQQLGTEDSYIFWGLPTLLTGIHGVKAIDGGAVHTIALKTDGTVWTWGSNFYGQLGDGTRTQRAIPAQVAGLSNVTAVSAGVSLSMALKSDGTVWTWGSNSSGQLGDGTTVDRLTPVQVSGLSGVKAIAAGQSHSVALKTDGTVWTWGDNSSGALGDGTKQNRSTPVQVNGLTNVQAISAGDTHTLALKSDGTVWAWGSNNFGQLGAVTNSDVTTPIQVNGLAGVAAISASSEISVVLKTDGTVWAWGSTSESSNQTFRATPRQVLWLTNITAIAAGGQHALALQQDGTVWAWGDNTQAQLGTGSSGYNRWWPVEVTEAVRPPDAIGILATPTFNPDGGTFNSAQSVKINSASSDAKISAVAFGWDHSLALMSDGTAWASGRNDWGQLGAVTNDPLSNQNSQTLVQVKISDAAALAAGATHSVALKMDGTVWAWGNNVNGQLGLGLPLGPNPNRVTPTKVESLTNVTAIKAGGAHTLALKSDGTVWGFGWNDRGQVGDGTQKDQSAPVQVSGLSNVKAISAGIHHNLALKTDGTVWAWGDNSYGELGDGSTVFFSLTPVQVAGLANIIAISAGGEFSTALGSDGTVWTWGKNSSGELGIGQTDNSKHPLPVQVNALNNISSISAGSYHAFATRADGTVWAWGNNFYGALGTGANTPQNQPTPFQVSALNGASNVKAGGNMSCMIKTDGSTWVWGDNGRGQLGIGSTVPQSNPVSLNQPANGALIHYTTNGSDPTEGDPVINSGSSVTIDHTMTLKAKVWKKGWAASNVKSAAFIINQPNPIDDPQVFVRQQYMDFLNREPDAGGLGYWTNEINKCGSDAQCIHDRRVGVADAFFFEAEFQQTGAFIYRVYKAAFGKRPTFTEFMANRGSVQPGPGLEQSKSAYALAFVQRNDFLQLYPRSQSSDVFVDALLNSIKQNSNVDLSGQRSTLMGLYDGTDNGRAVVLKQVSETQGLIDGEYNQSFVLMEYFGYLRRDPDQGGFDFWLSQVNKFPLRNVGIQHAMACSFITSAEYQLRFSTTVTHTNRECPQ